MQTKSHKTGILHLISSLEMGGIETLLLDFAETFSEIDSEFELVVVVMNNKYDPYLRKQLESLCKEVYFLERGEGDRNPKHLLRLFGIVNKHRIGVIHTHDHGSKHFSMLCKLRKPSLKLIFSVHDKFLFDSLSRLKMGLHKRVVNHNIAISNSVLQYCYENGINKASLIYNGIRFSRFKGGNREFMGDGILRIVNVGRITHRIKGQDILIRALHLLKQQGFCSFECHFIGGQYDYDKNSLPYLNSLVEQYGLVDKVKFLGNRNDVPKLLPQYDLFVMPSRTEGFGLVLLEALASGLDVISSNIEGPAELLQDGSLGLLFEVGNERDLCEKLMQASNSKYGIIKNSKKKQYLQKFDILTMCIEYLGLYRRLISKASSKEVAK
ncbi:glycosyl transferase family 1 [Paenibacillus baekrokdamisoli]|uniref:Glycosyl transferase family 1 n=1 Tax=Paenibacillus baekrokdamisoli TaxID=1712516 RepID=A0A3G9IVW7_9BACL|nr:glycosyltransferase [Paenibacillus baekrokdamisoli]MBB3067972.1 glycosyltransferase involved in cell wall biosynthesis [Paenibacillus baekrokdamisoli]BBH22980.1 glycosyl transferase family 1 [Paenibacillus baekrokdamisoli]